MARFYGRVRGGRGEATRCGHGTTGLRASASGWNIGGTVRMYDDGRGNDRVEMCVDGGSAGYGTCAEVLAAECDGVRTVKDLRANGWLCVPLSEDITTEQLNDIVAMLKLRGVWRE